MEKAISCRVFWPATADLSERSSRKLRASMSLAFHPPVLGSLRQSNASDDANWLSRVLVDMRGAQALNIDNERDIAIAQDRTPGNAFDALEILFERFDDHLLLADDIVHHQRHFLAALGFAKHHELLVFRRLGRKAEALSEIDH